MRPDAGQKRIRWPFCQSKTHRRKAPIPTFHAGELGNALGLKIRIRTELGSTGTLTIHYNDLDQLENVLKKLQA